VPGIADLDAIIAHLRSAERVLFITGAGLSADSGLPTYRGVSGLYADTDTEDGVPIEVALSGGMFRQDPRLCWKHIARIEEACRGAEPNRGHAVISELQDTHEVVVLTQNVDGLHQAAGSRDVIDIHGNVHDLLCPACPWTARVDDYAGLPIPPHCPDCRQVIRPDVVLFGEMLPRRKVVALHQELARGFDLVFSIGTTSVFPYIAEPVLMARRQGVPTVEINPGGSEVSHLVQHRLQAGAADVLGDLATRL